MFGKKNKISSLGDNKKKSKEYRTDFKRVFKASIRMFLYLLKKSPLFTSLFLLTIILTSIIPFINFWVGSKVIDELIAVISNPQRGTTVIFNLVLISIGISIVDRLLEELNTASDVNLWFKIGRDLTFDVTKKMATLDISNYEDSTIRDKLNKVSENSSMPQMFMGSLFWSVDSVVQIISASYILFVFSPIIILIMLITALPTLIINMLFGKRSYGIWDAKGDVRRDFGMTRRFLTDEESLMELRIFKGRGFLLNRMISLFDSFQKEQIKVENKRRVVSFLFSLIDVGGKAVSYVMIAFAVIAQRITVGQYSFYTSAAVRLQEGLKALLRRLARVYEQGLYVADIFDVLDIKEEIVSGDIKLAKVEEAPLIEVKDVSFKYPSNSRYILKNFNLTINPGEHVAIVGENGAGKTTLIKLLMRFYDVSGGAILVNGKNLRDLNLDSWYDQVGALFQEYNFYHFDAKTNIGIGDVDKINDFEGIVKAAKKSGAHEFIDKYEKKYDQVLSPSFSGGIRPSVDQRQKIALARAFFNNAPILILDEPTSAIDPKAEYEIFEKLFDYAKGKTVIIISHRFSTVRNAQRIIVLDKGNIVEEGSHEELMKIKNGKYSHAFELQRRGYI